MQLNEIEYTNTLSFNAKTIKFRTIRFFPPYIYRRPGSSSRAAAGRRTLSLWPHVAKSARGDIGGDYKTNK